MAPPYTIATLLYFFNEEDEVLLLERTQQPNRGLWSPCGGKLKTETGESPYACASREAWEELGLIIQPGQLHLTGIISEQGRQDQGHWLMFLFEAAPRLTRLPAPHREGLFRFFPQSALAALALPQGDLEYMWPLFWRHRHGFFAARCYCRPDGQKEWNVEERWSGRDKDGARPGNESG